MAKLKAAKKGKASKTKHKWAGAIPCLVVLLGGFLLLMLLFTSLLSTSK